MWYHEKQQNKEKIGVQKEEGERVSMREKNPLYIEIYQDIKQKIEHGHYSEGEKLSSIRNLSDVYGVSRNTIIKALQELELEGFIKAVEKSGFYVLDTEYLYPKKMKTERRQRRCCPNRRDYKLDCSHNAIAYQKLPISTMQKLYREVLAQGDYNFVYHSHPQGKQELRYAISRHLKQSRDMEVDENCIIVSAGMEYLYQIILQLIEKNSIFGIETPGYDVLPSMLEMNGFAYIEVPVDESGLKVEVLHHTNVNIQVVTPSHQFPTGCVMNIARRKKLIEWAKETDSRYLIEDDYDGEFKYSGKPTSTLFSMDEYSRTVYMGSFSKTIAPAMRISYMVLPNSLMRVYNRKLPFMSCPVSSIQQEFLARFLKENYYQRHINRMKYYYKKIHQTLKKELMKYEVVECISTTEIGLHITVSLCVSEDEETIVKRMREQGILISGMKNFDRHGYYHRPTLLLGFGGMNLETIEEDVSYMMSIITQGGRYEKMEDV